jgi:putative membrane protein
MKSLILCVDRDNDLGRKTGIGGPVIGRKACVDAAIALARADPRDTDANTMFEAVKTYEELKKEGKDVKVAVLTGDINVGLKSDEIIVIQLKKALKGCNGVIFVSDGADDEQLIPIIQSYTTIKNVRRVIVKQAEILESVYYTILDFAKRVLKDKELSRLILGVPGIAALIYAILGAEGWRLIVGVVGSYLIIKGLQLEQYIDRLIQEIRIALRHGRPSFFIYIISILLFTVAMATGLNAVSEGPLAFLKASDFIFLSSALGFFLAKALDSQNISARLDYVSSGVLTAALIWVFDSVVSIMAEGSGFGLTITPLFLGLVIIFFTMLGRKLIRKWKGY